MASAYKLAKQPTMDDAIQDFIMNCLDKVAELEKNHYGSHVRNLARTYIELECHLVFLGNIQDFVFLGSPGFVKALMDVIDYQLQKLWKSSSLRHEVNMIKVKKVMES